MKIIVFGAICAGPVILEQAWLLKNQKIAHGYMSAQLKYLLANVFLKETKLTEDAVIANNNIVTARTDPFTDFAKLYS